jgi:hypothetical protein
MRQEARKHCILCYTANTCWDKAYQQGIPVRNRPGQRIDAIKARGAEGVERHKGSCKAKQYCGRQGACAVVGEAAQPDDKTSDQQSAVDGCPRSSGGKSLFGKLGAALSRTTASSSLSLLHVTWSACVLRLFDGKLKPRNLQMHYVECIP